MKLSEVYLQRFQALHPVLIDLSLGRIERLLARLGHPERRMGPVIHVGGTNGKGSTIAFLRAMLEAAGKRVHVFTSPHLVAFNERIRLAAPGGGQLATEEQLVAAFEHVEAVNGADPITFFEITTAAAFHLFATHPADITLVEVGLGGAFDATNVFEQPAAAVITPVSLDHKEHLGDTVEKIATTKSGIFKRGAPAIIAPQDETPSRVLQRAAERIGARPMVGGEDFALHEEHGRLVYQDAEGLIDLPLPRLPGRHQHINAATAIATLRTVFGAGFPVAAIEKGLQQVEWPARLQHLTGQLAALTPSGAELWLDGGHNADGARALAAAMADLEERNPRPLVVVLGLMARKDADAILEPFRGLAQEFYAVDIPGNEKTARKADDLAILARDLGLPCAVAGDVAQTLRFLSQRSWPRPPRILIAGSLYLAGEVLKADGSLPK
ncbi:MAG TPA: folylpolyglutamate synthase/dihydrofolate synthase family protein [Beijerinckiaceae bacterium]|nr:folylpolyglutamate synthase/dihydrofolate synthase family protein [Beijerinckiaceae bacterium]